MTLIDCRKCKTAYADFRNQCPTCGLQKPVKTARFYEPKHDRYCAACDGPVNSDTRCDCCDEPVHKKCLARHEQNVMNLELQDLGYAL